MNNDVNNTQMPYIPINNTQVDNNVPTGMDKKKLFIVIGIILVGIILVVFIFNNLFSVGNLSLNYRYVNSVDSNMFVVFKDNGECLFNDYSVTNCSYEKRVDKLVVNVGYTYGSKEYSFKLKSDDSIELFKRVTNMFNEEYDDPSVIIFNKDDKEFVSTKRVTLDESLYDDYNYSGVIPITKPKTTTTRYGYYTTTTTAYRTTINPITGLDDYASKNGLSIKIPGYSRHYDYAEEFYIENGNLYVVIDPYNGRTNNYHDVHGIIEDGTAVSLLHVRNRNNNDYYLFVRMQDGSLFYINNFIESTHPVFYLIQVPSVLNIKRGYFTNSNIYLYDDNGKAYYNVYIDRGIRK